MRHNRTQAEIGESFGVSQPTVSRAISAITPLIPEAVREFVPTADDLDPTFAKGLERAAAAGVEVLVYGCSIELEEISLDRRVPWMAEPQA